MRERTNFLACEVNNLLLLGLSKFSVTCSSTQSQLKRGVTGSLAGARAISDGRLQHGTLKEVVASGM